MTSPVIEAMEVSLFIELARQVDGDCGTPRDGVMAVLKALEENITDEMLAAATLAVREHDETAFIQDGWNNKTTKIDGEVDFSKVFTAMLRAAREE